MVSVVVKDPTGSHTVRQLPLRGVSQGTIAPHTWMQVNGITAFVPIGIEIELDEPFLSALSDAGFSIEEVVVVPPEPEEGA